MNSTRFPIQLFILFSPLRSLGFVYKGYTLYFNSLFKWLLTVKAKTKDPGIQGQSQEETL